MIHPRGSSDCEVLGCGVVFDGRDVDGVGDVVQLCRGRVAQVTRELLPL